MLTFLTLLALLTSLQALELGRKVRQGSAPQSTVARVVAWVASPPQWKAMNLGFTAVILTCAIWGLRPTHRRGLRLAKGQCPWCGYERHGLPRALVCPECGRSPRRRERPLAQQSGPA